jgi:hypothetical protein
MPKTILTLGQLSDRIKDLLVELGRSAPVKVDHTASDGVTEYGQLEGVTKRDRCLVLIIGPEEEES